MRVELEMLGETRIWLPKVLYGEDVVLPTATVRELNRLLRQLLVQVLVHVDQVRVFQLLIWHRHRVLAGAVTRHHFVVVLVFVSDLVLCQTTLLV